MPASEIPALYYLSNFHTVLDWVANRYADLLTDEEQTFIERFRSLPCPSFEWLPLDVCHVQWASP